MNNQNIILMKTNIFAWSDKCHHWNILLKEDQVITNGVSFTLLLDEYHNVILNLEWLLRYRVSLVEVDALWMGNSWDGVLSSTCKCFSSFIDPNHSHGGFTNKAIPYHVHS